MNQVFIALTCVTFGFAVGLAVFRHRPRNTGGDVTTAQIDAHRSRLATVAAAQRGIFAEGADPERLLNSVTRWALAIVDCDAALISTPDGNELVCRSVVGGDKKLLGSRVPLAGTVSGRCFVTNMPAVGSDAEAVPSTDGDVRREFAGRSCVTVPLLAADPDVPFGVLQLISRRPNAFDDDDVAALTVVSQIARKALTETALIVALQTSEARLRTIVDHLPETAVMVFDRDLVLEMAGGPGARTWRYAERNVLPGLRLDEFISAGDLAILGPHYQAALDGIPATLEFHSSRLGLDFEVQTAPMFNDDRTVGHALVMVSDVTQRKASEIAVRVAELQYRTAFEAAPVGMAQVSLTGVFEAVNRAFCELIGYTAEQLCGMSFTEVSHPDAHEQIRQTLKSMAEGAGSTWSSEGRFIHASTRVVWVNQSTTVVRDIDGHATHFLSHYVDNTDRKAFDSQLKHLSEHDPLTGLQNRRSFEVEIKNLAASIVRNGPAGALLVLDLDHFKHINDTLGHGAGDELIVSLADVLRRRLRSTDVIARLGGDEFAVLLVNTTPDQATRVAAGLLEAIRDEVTIASEGRSRRLTTSIGIALFDKPGLVATDVLRNADLTMFEAKAAGGDRYAIYRSDAPAEPRGKSRRAWIDRIANALEHDRFTLFAQPILDLSSRIVTRHELLLRMIGDDGELILPNSFLSVAENAGQIMQIDRWVVNRAISVLDSERNTNLRFEVNLSGLSIGDPQLLAFIEQRLTESPSVDPSQLIFEVTETVAVANMDLARVFAERLSGLGCSFALDDFGAGYGSFYYLKHLPFDDLKIDGEFIAQCVDNPTDALVIDAIVGVARGLGKRTIAEFVGDDETLEFLAARGVDMAQGYHIGHPVPLEVAIAMKQHVSTTGA